MIRARAPLRITLGGGGTDLPSYYTSFGGFVMAAAIDKYVSVDVASPSGNGPERAAVPVTGLTRAVLQLMGVRDEIEIRSASDVPPGTGLGSSGSYAVALVAALGARSGDLREPREVAELAFEAERDVARRPVGSQDHYIAALGGLTALTIGRDGAVTAEPLAIEPDLADALHRRLLLFFTGEGRDSEPILREQADGSLAGRTEMLESLHRTKELGLRARALLQAGDLDAFGSLLDEHWSAKKRRSRRMSSPAVEQCYEAARSAGAAGGKLVGAGGGGFLMLYASEERAPAVRAIARERGFPELAYRFEAGGVRTSAP